MATVGFGRTVRSGRTIATVGFGRTVRCGRTIATVGFGRIVRLAEFPLRCGSSGVTRLARSVRRVSIGMRLLAPIGRGNVGESGDEGQSSSEFHLFSYFDLNSAG